MTFAVVLCAAGLAHAWHAWTMTGEGRWWHAGHVVMAAGMVAMCFVPRGSDGGAYWAGTAVFGGLCVAAATHALVVRHRAGRLSWRWTSTAADMAAMMYMSLPAAGRLALPSFLLVTYLCVEALLWALAPSRRPSPRVRAGLVTMSVAMAWMLIAMQETSLTPGSPSGPMRM